MMDTALVALGFVSVAAAWDAVRRHIDASRYNQQTLDRINELERRLDKQHEQVQALMGKLNAATAATANRTPRLVGR